MFSTCCRKRPNSFLGKSLIAEKQYQDQLIFDSSTKEIELARRFGPFRVHFRQAPKRTLDSKISEGIMKTLSAEFKRKINFLEETQYKNRRPKLTGRERDHVFLTFSFTNIKKTPRQTTNLSQCRGCTTTISTCSIKSGKTCISPWE